MALFPTLEYHPDLETDGWRVENGEALNAQHPTTFWIPDEASRQDLHPGDYAKLVFEIRTGNAKIPIVGERMWVLVRERADGGYLGVLHDQPSMAANKEFGWGYELPFSPRHVIQIETRTKKTIALARVEPKWRWLRQGRPAA